jgi:hypothetical protein
VVLAIVIAGHVILYHALINFLGISNVFTRNVLFAVLICLSLSFVIASLVVHWFDTPFTRAIYDAAGFWLGLMLNLLLASLFILVVVTILGLIGWKFNLRDFSIIIFVLTLVYSGFSVWTAANPKIKNITVSAKNLPAYWTDKTIVQLSDVHLGSVHRPDFLSRVVKKVNSLNPELVVITGDLFDGMDGDLDSFIEPLNKIRSAQGVYFVTGNHEAYLGVEDIFKFLEKTQIKVLHDDIVDIDGLQLVGINYPEFEGQKDIREIIRPGQNFFPEKPTILLYHTPTNVVSDKAHAKFNTYWYPDVDFSYAKEIGIDLQLSGHVHKGQLFPFTWITKLIYRGYDYGLKIDGGFSIYVSSGTGTWGPPMRTGNSPEIVAVRLK